MGGSGAQSLSGRAARSGVWIGGGFVVQRGLQLVSNLVLTRLLFPEAFGLMALCSVFLVGLQLFSDFGLRPAIICDPRGNEPDFLNTAWTIQVIRGFVLCVAGSMLAFPISLIYNEPILLNLLVVLSTTAAISGFNSINMLTAERDLNFRTITFIQIAGQIVQILTMVVLAYVWRSVWSLAIGGTVSSFTTLAIGHLLLRGHQHRLQIDTVYAKSLIHFGKWIFLSTIVTFLGGEGLRAIQAGFITPAEFGVLAIAYSIAAIPIELSTKLIASIGIPALSEAYRDNPNNFANVLYNFRKRVFLLSALMVAGVTLTSEPIITLLYDNRYHSAGPLVAIITISSAVNLVTAGYGSVLLTVSKSQTFMWTTIFATVTRICGTIVGLRISGVEGMIAGVGIANLATVIIYWPIMHQIHVRQKLLDMSFLTLLLALSVINYWC